MIFTAEIDIMPLKELLDPQGKTVGQNLQRNGIGQVKEVKVGKHIQLKIEANNEDEANKLVQQACTNLLVNKVMEYYQYTLTSS